MKMSGTALASSICFCLAVNAQADPLDAAFTSRYDNPEDVFILGEYIRTANDAGQYDQAISSIEEHLVRFANDGRARLAAARLYANVGSWDLVAAQARAALDSGQLSAKEEREAAALLRRAHQGQNGIEWFVDAGAGIRVTHIDVNAPVPASSWRDRTTTGGYGEISGALRYDLGTDLGNAFVFAGRFGVVRQYQDAFMGAAPLYGLEDGKIANSVYGRGSITFDMGLPVTAIDSARLQFGVFTDYRTVHPGIRIRSLGGVVRGVVLPTVDTRLYAEYSYEDLSASTGIAAEYRHSWEAGASYRISQVHAIGVAARGAYDYAGGLRTGRLEEGEITYSGRLPFRPFGTIWTHDVSLAAGTFESLGLPPGPPSPVTGDLWRAEWSHQFHIDGHNRIDLSYEMTDYDYDQPVAAGRGATTHTFNLGYTHRF